MKRIGLLGAVIALSLLVGCFTIHEVNQPEGVSQGEQLLITLGVSIEGYDNNVTKGVACVMLPYDWTVDSAFWYSPYHMGRGWDEELVENETWTGYAETRFPSGDMMDWHGYITENAYSNPVADSGYHVYAIYYYVTVGQELGDFGLSYLISDTGLTDAGMGFPDAYSPEHWTPEDVMAVWWDSTFNVTITVTQTKVEESPYGLHFYQNRPNPFNATTAISYTLPTASLIRLSIHNILGEEIKVLKEDMVSEGTHMEVWDGSDKNGNLVSNGVYFCRLLTDERVFTKKLAFTR